MNKITESEKREMHNHRRPDPDPDPDGASVELVALVPSMGLEPKDDLGYTLRTSRSCGGDGTGREEADRL